MMSVLYQIMANTVHTHTKRLFVGNKALAAMRIEECQRLTSPLSWCPPYFVPLRGLLPYFHHNEEDIGDGTEFMYICGHISTKVQEKQIHIFAESNSLTHSQTQTTLAFRRNFFGDHHFAAKTCCIV